jgi:hypothetical protein
VLGGAQPQRMFYEIEKTRHRVSRMITSLESISGARPGSNLRVDFRSDDLEKSIARVGRRMSFGFAIGGAMIGAAIIASSRRRA